MPNPREPINILLAKGRKHLTQEEIQRRMATEPTAPADDIQPPDYLSKKQREEFSALAGELQRIKIIGNVDAGELARYVVAHGFYARYTKLLRTLPRKSGRGCGSCGPGWRRRKGGPWPPARRSTTRTWPWSWSAAWPCSRTSISPSARPRPGPWGLTSPAAASW